MLTPGICDMPAHVQEAIACHELLHVQRRDWLYELLEAAVVTVLWFHPAIWMLIGRIRLAREQVVDEATIRLTESRERYVESLLAVARARLFPLVFTRITLLAAAPSEEAGRPDPAGAHHDHPTPDPFADRQRGRAGTCRGIRGPFIPAGSAGARRGGFWRTHSNGEGRRAPASRRTPGYPHRAIEQRVEGDVQVEMTLNERGEVSDARVLSGPEELRRATLESVLGWHYSPAALASTITDATLRFRVPPPEAEQELKKELWVTLGDISKVELEHHRLKELEAAIADPATTEEQRLELKLRLARTRAEMEQAFLYQGQTVGFAVTKRAQEGSFEGTLPLLQIKTERVSAETVKEVLNHAGVSVGDRVTAETMKRLEEVAQAMDEHFRVEYKKVDDGIVVMLLAR